MCAPSVFFGYYSLSCGFVTLNAWFLCGIRNIHMYMYHWLQCQSMAGISFYAISPHFFTPYAFLLILCFVATEMKFFLFIIRSFVCSSIIFLLNLAIPGIVSLLHFSPKFTCFISWDQFSLVSTSSEMINFQKRVKTPHNWIAHSNQQEDITVPFLVRSCVRLLIFCCWFFLWIYFRCCWFSWFPFALLHILSVF